MSRRKGASGEREAADLLKSLLLAEGVELDIRRTPASGGRTKGDCYGLPGYHLEIKRQETIHIHKWMAQAIEDAPDGDVPLVIFRRSRDPWKVVIDLRDFAPLLAAGCAARLV